MDVVCLHCKSTILLHASDAHNTRKYIFSRQSQSVCCILRRHVDVIFSLFVCLYAFCRCLFVGGLVAHFISDCSFEYSWSERCRFFNSAACMEQLKHPAMSCSELISFRFSDRVGEVRCEQAKILQEHEEFNTACVCMRRERGPMLMNMRHGTFR